MIVYVQFPRWVLCHLAEQVDVSDTLVTAGTPMLCGVSSRFATAGQATRPNRGRICRRCLVLREEQQP